MKEKQIRKIIEQRKTVQFELNNRTIRIDPTTINIYSGSRIDDISLTYYWSNKNNMYQGICYAYFNPTIYRSTKRSINRLFIKILKIDFNSLVKHPPAKAGGFLSLALPD